jgi:hypothetical protein
MNKQTDRQTDKQKTEIEVIDRHNVWRLTDSRHCFFDRNDKIGNLKLN